MTRQTLPVQARQLVGRQVKQLRASHLIPGHVYGKQLPSINIQVPIRDFQTAFKLVGESSLLYLQVSGEPSPRPVFVSSVSYHPVTSSLLHVSFHQVNLKEKITAPVALKLIGESSAVRDHLGVLVQQLDTLDIEALPADMPDHIDVDISPLVSVGDSVLVKDLTLAASLTVQTDPEAQIAKIEPLAKEEVAAPVPAPAEATAETPPETPAVPSSDQPPKLS